MPTTTSVKRDRFADAAENTAAAERDIQQRIDSKEKARPKEAKKDQGAMQAGATALSRAAVSQAASRETRRGIRTRPRADV